MNAQYCSDCGAEVATGSRYCSNCGERITEVTQSPTVTTDPGYSSAAGKDTTFAAITHILALFTWVLGPLIVLLVTDDPFVHENARNALNWQIMLTIYMFVAAILVFVMIGIPLVFVIPLLNMVFCIIAALKANEGEAWRYPATPDIV